MLEELLTFQNIIKPLSIIVIRGSVLRYYDEEHRQTAFILYEAP